MTAGSTAPGGNDDIKARFREALERKQSNDPGVEQGGHAKKKGHDTHGPAATKRVHRRKAGGGGA